MVRLQPVVVGGRGVGWVKVAKPSNASLANVHDEERHSLW